MSPALAKLPPELDSRSARAILLTIGLQESLFLHRRQLIGSPPTPTGRGNQFLASRSARRDGPRSTTRKLAAALYARHNVPANDLAIWSAIEHNDVLAAGLARLLLYTAPLPLPPGRRRICLGPLPPHMAPRCLHPRHSCRSVKAARKVHSFVSQCYRSCIAVV